MANRSFLKNSFSLMFLTTLSRILGMVREITIASFLGTSALADIYRVGNTIPNFLRRLFAEGTMATAFVPTCKGYFIAGDQRDIRDFLSSSLTVLTLLVSVTVGIGMAITPVIVIPFGTEIQETTIVTRIMFPYLGFISLAALFQGILNASGIFSPSGFVPVLFNLCVIGSAYLLSPVTDNPARAISWGVFAGGLVQAAFQIPFIMRLGYRFRFISPRRAFSHPGVRKMGRLIAPTIVGMAAYQVNDVVATILAGQAGEGILSSLTYSLRLQELVLGIIVVSISTVLLTELTGNAKRADWEGFSSNLTFSLKIIVLITIPIVFYSQLHGVEIITLLFRNMAFDDYSVNLTMKAFQWHITAILFVGFIRILAPVFYAMEDTKTPALAGIVSVAATIVLAAILVIPFKGAGIALATTLAALVNASILFGVLLRQDRFDAKKILGELLLYILKMTFFSAVCTIPVFFLKPVLLSFFPNSGKLMAFGIPLLVDSVVFFALGFGVLFLVRDKQLLSLVRLFRKPAKD